MPFKVADSRFRLIMTDTPQPPQDEAPNPDLSKPAELAMDPYSQIQRLAAEVEALKAENKRLKDFHDDVCAAYPEWITRGVQ
jgi:hypothetical protein